MGTQHVRRFFGRPKRVIALAAGLAILGVYAAMPALAVHDTGVFQLDRNALTSDDAGTVPASHDWDQICAAVLGGAQCGNPAGTAGTSVVSFDVDPTGQTIFTGGGSKDPKDIQPNWLYKSGSVPAKDELLHGFAARYSAPIDTSTVPPDATLCPANVGQTDCELLYFGADRLDASGDSQIGFWFFQNRIGLTNTASNGGFKFSGVHKDGDILVLSDFTQGGGTPNIKVLMWNSSSDPTLPGGGTGSCSGNPKNCDNLIVLGGSSSTPADCIGPPTVGPGDGFCATVNDQTETAPWSFLDKSGSSNFLPGEFYEGGINLSTLPFGVASECFSSFETETRSSADADAVLKDFVLGNFGNCGSSTVTTPQDSSGTNITAPVTIGVNGSVQVQDRALVSGTGPATTDPTGTVKFFICGAFPDSDTTSNCATGGTQVGLPLVGETLVSTGTPGSQSAATSDLTTISAVGRYCFRAEYSGDSNFPASSDPTSATDTSLSECFSVVKRPTSITTQATAGPVFLNSPISDTATLMGATSDATGGITFTLYGPFDASTPASGDTCTAGNLVTTIGPIAIGSPNASGNYVVSSGDYTPSAVGRYQWIASYGGDAKNEASTTACGDANEASVVAQAASSITTSPFVFPNDSATVSASTGGNVSGTVTFSLYDTAADCSTGGNTGLLFTQTKTLAGGSTSETVSTQNGKTDDAVTDYSTAADTTVFWRVLYSGDSTHFGRNSLCTESTALDETADSSGGTAP